MPRPLARSAPPNAAPALALSARLLIPLCLAPISPAHAVASAPQAPLSAPESSPDTTVAEISQTPRIGLWSCWLTNGVRVHAKSLPSAAEPAFAIAITITGGELLEPPGKRGLAAAATGGWSLPKEPDAAQSEIVKRYLESQVRFFAVANTDSIQLWLTGPEADLDAALALARLLLERPGLDADAFNARVQSLRDITTKADPGRAAIDALRPFILPASMPSARPILASDLPALDPASGLDWLTAAIMQGSIEIGIASRIPAPDTLERAAAALASLPGRPRISASTLANLRESPCPEPPASTLILPQGPARQGDPPHKGGSLALIALVGPPLADLTERRALALGAFVLDDRLEAAIANDRASDSRREVSVFPMHPGIRTARAVVGALIASPAPSPEGTARTPDPAADAELIASHFAALATVGPLAIELDAARARVTEILSRQDLAADAWASRLATLTYDGLSPASLAAAIDEYRALTPADVRRAYAAWWTPSSTVRVIINGSASHSEKSEP